MGNSEDSQKIYEKINLDEIIENDCYEEVDINKINKIKEEERNWNKNSIIYSVNDLKELNEEDKLEDQILKEKSRDIIIEQKNEEGSEDVKDKKIIEKNEENKIQNENNIEKNDNIEENKDLNIEDKKDNNNKTDNKDNNIGNNNDMNNNIGNNNDMNNNIENNNIENNINEKKNNLNEENNNLKEEEKNNKVNDDKNNSISNQDINGRNKRHSIKIKNMKAKIKPKNTGDDALNNKLLSKKNNNEKKSPNNSQNKIDSTSHTQKNSKNNSDNNTIENRKISIPLNERKSMSDEFDIKNIISEYRLNHLKDDEIIYCGTLEKILKIPDRNTIVYSQRFCIFTKNYFAYYRSKESYISVNKPMLLINNNFIIRIESTILDGGSYYFGIICEINDETRNIINKVNSFVTNEGNICELLLGFRTKKYENMMKWVIILRYFTSNQKDGF